MSRLESLVVELPEDIRRLVEMGDFKGAVRRIERILKEDERLPKLLRERLEYEIERLERVRKDYPLTREEAFNKLKKEIPDLTPGDFERWMWEGYIDYRLIDGEEKFFKNFIPNLFRFCKEAETRRVKKVDEVREKAKKLLHQHIDKLLEVGPKSSTPYLFPVRNRVEMKLTIKPDVIPSGEKVRVWLPIPRRDPLQPEARIISASPKNYYIAPENHPQRTIYFEAVVEEGKPLVFKVEYEYTVTSFYLDVNPEKVKPYDEESEIYQKYTSEQLPHIAFTPHLCRLTDEIVNGETNPYLKAWRIYKWITHNVKYASAYEYSTYGIISEYVARNLKGDCGMQALLFITLCRISGVPARWQSGWYMNPVKPGMHDWAQFYVEPYGWLYVDASFGGARRNIPKYNRFYFGNIDRYRLVCNIDISSDFDPPKRYLRSDPVDNQRGEVEWRKGNLYYDKWAYELKILSHEELTSRCRNLK